MCSWCVTSSEEGRCGTRLGYRWTGGREEVYKEEREWMTSEPDSVYIEHRTVHLSRLMAHTSWRRRHFHLTRISGNSLALCSLSNHPQAPVPPPESYQGTQLHSICYRRSVRDHSPLYVPSDWVRKRNPVSPRPWTPTAKALHTLITIAPF